jgi:hypothetical protein
MTSPRAELLGGKQFARPERSVPVQALVDQAQAALEAGMRLVARAGCVLRDADVLLSTLTVAIPDLVLYRGATCNSPDLVVEYCAEADDPIVFESKRRAYGRARIPEGWFVDVATSSITVLRLRPGVDNPWLAKTFGFDATLRSSAIPGLAAPAHVLLRVT